MAIVIKNIPKTLRTLHCRGIERAQWKNQLVIDCSCLRIIDLSVSLDEAYGANAWLKVYDAKDVNDPTNITSSDITLFPTVKLAPGENVSWSPETEWTPVNFNLIVVASSTQVAYNMIAAEVLDIYVRYSTKELTYGLSGESDHYVHD